MNFLGVPLGYAILFIYKVVPNYTLSIIIFTVIFKIVLLPMMFKQHKSMIKTTILQPYLNEINKKYAKNITKKTEEIQKFNQKFGLNPASGCLMSLVPFLVLLGIVDVVYNPLVHILHIPKDVIDSATNIFKSCNANASDSKIQLNLINDVISFPQRYSSIGSEFIDSVKSIDLNFLGFNICDIADIFSFKIIFPILSVVFSFLQIYISFKTNSLAGSSGFGNFKVMMVVMTLFSIWISFTVPIGVSIYGIVNYATGIIQTVVFNKICNMKEYRENETKKITAYLKNKNSNKNVDESKDEVLKSSKERISAARKKLYEKYDS